MLNYYDALKTYLAVGGYALADAEDRIDKLWVEGKLTTEQRDELRAFAAESAKDEYQIDVLGQLADLQRRVYDLEHPVDQYEIWTTGKTTKQHEIVRYDVTGDGELDLCQYNGGRSYTALSIGKIEGWNMLDRELNRTHTITRDADGNFVLTPVETETEPTTTTEGE